MANKSDARDGLPPGVIRGVLTMVMEKQSPIEPAAASPINKMQFSIDALGIK
jgi:hypothetical protein